MVDESNTVGFVFLVYYSDMAYPTRGQKPSLALGLPMPGNSFINAPEVDQSYLDAQTEKVATLLPALRERRVEDYATRSQYRHPDVTLEDIMNQK